LRRHLIAAVVAVAALIIVTAYWISTASYRSQRSRITEELRQTLTGPIKDRLPDTINDLGFRLLTRLAEKDKDKNVIISPVSMYFALSMLENGASGGTRDAIGDVLQVRDVSLEDLNSANLALLAGSTTSDDKVKIRLANSIWAHKTITLNPDFVERNKTFYKAKASSIDLQSPDAVSTINKWVSDNTGGMINRAIGGVDPGTISMLINTAYFDGCWTEPFKPGDTKDGSFYTSDGREVPVKMMYGESTCRMYLGEGLSAIALPYGKGRASLYVFQPSRKDGNLPAFLKKLSVDNWKSWVSSCKETKLPIYLPKLKLGYAAEEQLKQVLCDLGMDPAFGSDADFSAMATEGAAIGRVRHETQVEFNEKGTKAAATSLLDMFTGGGWRIDRPFFFAIRDNKTGVILFMGTVVDPSKI
jgi:serpin B